MIRSSTLEVLHQDKTAFRYDDSQGDRPTVMAALVASIACVGLDNVRAGFLAQKWVCPDEGASTHVSEDFEVSPEAWAQARAAYAQCAQSRTRTPWALEHLADTTAEAGHKHAHMGVLFTLAPEMCNETTRTVVPPCEPDAQSKSLTEQSVPR